MAMIRQPIGNEMSSERKRDSRRLASIGLGTGNICERHFRMLITDTWNRVVFHHDQQFPGRFESD